jgi:4-hydroxybenzoate polyprenyltransferase
MSMTLVFQIIAAILVGSAAYFLWQDNFDWALAAFAVGVCSYFLGMRFQIKKRMAERESDPPG